MSGLRRRPVLYRSQVQVWLVLAAGALVLTVVFVPPGRQQVIAFVVLGLAVAVAVMVWKVSEYRRYRLGPITSTGSILAPVVGSVSIMICSRIVGSGGPLLASGAGFLAGAALAVPVIAYFTAFRDPPPASTSTTVDLSAAGGD